MGVPIPTFTGNRSIPGLYRDPGDCDRPAGETGTPRRSAAADRARRAPRAVGADVVGGGPSPFRRRPVRKRRVVEPGDRRRRWAGGSPPPRASDTCTRDAEADTVPGCAW
jgi:hypothetical protein